VNGPLRLMIVDDERPARERLARLIAACDEAELVGQAADGQGLLSECRRLQPDVLLMDVEMPGRDGVSLARELGQLSAPPAVVFVTAFERYAVEAFDLQAVDYLVKPVRQDRLEAALLRVRQRLMLGRKSGPVLLARLGERVSRIPLADVRALLAEDKYVSVHHAGGQALIEESLVNIEKRFPNRFLRIHRNALVSQPHLRALFRDGEGAERVELDDVEVCPEVSRRNLPAVRRVLKESP